jgi:hypothetical protein
MLTMLNVPAKLHLMPGAVNGTCVAGCFTKQRQEGRAEKARLW